MEFYDFGSLLEKADIIEDKYIIGDETQTETIITRLMTLCSMIPTFTYQNNCRKVTAMQQKLDTYVVKVIEKLRTEIEDWEKKLKAIKEKEKDVKKLKLE